MVIPPTYTVRLRVQKDGLPPRKRMTAVKKGTFIFPEPEGRENGGGNVPIQQLFVNNAA